MFSISGRLAYSRIEFYRQVSEDFVSEEPIDLAFDQEAESEDANAETQEKEAE